MSNKKNLLALFILTVMASRSVVAQQFELLFYDDFDSENGQQGELNYSGFKNWRVVSGSVDLIGAGTPYDFLPGNGLYVDLDGTTNQAGTLESNAISTVGGDHVVQFFLAGSQRGGGTDFVEVFFNELSLAALELPSNAPFLFYSYDVFIPSGSSPKLRFVHTGNDNIGLLLDRVSVLRKIPFTGCLVEPESAAVEAGGFHEFVVRALQDDRSLSSSVVVSAEVVEGPNEGLRVPRTGEARFRYQAFPTGSADTDTIRATVQIDGVRYTCDGTVKWGAFAPACLAGNDRTGRRHVLIVHQAAAEWTACGISPSEMVYGEYEVDRQGRPIRWRSLFEDDDLLEVQFDGLQPTRATIVSEGSVPLFFLPELWYDHEITIEDDDQPCRCN
jgi:hypothetical protein